MKILTYAFLLSSFLVTQAELVQHDMAQVLHVSEDLAASIIKRIKYIDRLNTSHAPYYPILSQFLKERGYKTGCEVGVFTGGHAEFILANSPVEKLYCVDSYRAPMHTDTIITEGFERSHWQACWETIYHYSVDKLAAFGDRAEFIRLPSEQAATMIADDSLDFVFIDGDHSYAGALADCVNYYDKVRSGGIVAGDDYNIEDVGRALHDFFGEKKLVINIYAGQKRFWWVEKP